MRMVLNIAKAELRNLFYSPVAWFLAIAFLVQCGWFYTSAMYPFAKIQEAMLDFQPGFKKFGIPITYQFFLAPNSVFTIALQNLYLFVPLLTMGLLSREVNSGTIRLLYSSPVKLRQVVLGKYLAIMTYNLMLVCIIGIFLVTALFNIRSADYGMLLSAALGFYLLTCAYTAIGLFMSSLTNYQILSAIGTFIAVFILGRIGGLWQHIDFVRDLTYFLFLSGRTGRMLKGLIASKDVIYFATMVFMFLGFTLIRLRAAREAKPWYVQLGRTVTVVCIALIAGYILSLPKYTLYWDVTAGEKNTIHKRTQEIIREMNDEPLEVTLYTNLLGGEATYGFPEARNSYLTTLWEQYQRFKPDITFRYVYYYYYDSTLDDGALKSMFPGKNNEQMATELAKGYKVNLSSFSPPDTIKKMLNLQPEGHRLVMQLKYKDRTEFLRTYKPPQPFPGGSELVWPMEMNMAATLKRLLHPESIPTILFTNGNLERNIYKSGSREYSSATTAKGNGVAPINLGFDVDTIALDTQDIPAGITALVIADPKTELSPLSRKKIIDYIDKGGNTIFIGEPGKQHVLNPVLQHLGVQLEEGNLVQPTYNEQPHMVLPLLTAAGTDLAEEQTFIDEKKGRLTGFAYDTVKILMPGVTSISFSDSGSFTRKPALMTDGKKTWLKKGTLVTDSAEVVYSPQEGDRKGSFATALQLSRKVGNKEQRIAIYSDADFASNLRGASGGDLINRAVFSWMSNSAYPIYLPKAEYKDNLLTVSARTVKILNIIYVWALPALVVIAGVILLVRRKRK